MKTEFETDSWPLIPAKFFLRVPGRRSIRLIVVHCMEGPEQGETAENVGRYLQTISRPASAHVGVDSDSVVQYVRDNDVAFGAPGVNRDGIHVELAGYAKQTRDEWLDDYGRQMLRRAADVVAQYSLKYNLPPVHLTAAQLKQGARGIIGHADATAVYKPNAGHTDPGANFPWDYFLERVAVARNERQKERTL